MHNTGAFSVWIDDARQVAKHLEDAATDDVTCGIVIELRQWALKFERWLEDPSSRPAPAERLPHRSQFMTVYRRALDRVVELARARPDGGGWRRPT